MKNFPVPYKKPEVEEVKKEIIFFECIYGNHKADLLHRGTAYCRPCYDERNPIGKLIN